MTDLATPSETLPALALRASDYPRINAALDFIAAHWDEQPSLERIAQAAGLSPHHFQRVFTRWTGASPKRMIAALTHASARRLMREGASVLEAALETGLSGPSRLHDVFIAEEAVTPGNARSAGIGLEFAIGHAPTPFGTGVFLIAPRGLSALAFADAGREAEAEADLRSRFPAAGFTLDHAAADHYAQAIFGEGGTRPVPLVLYGTPWRRQVWRALLAIPPGETTSYGEIARDVCTARASRAVGAAVGANPVSWLIPCHRVLASDGRLNGYHWGLERKRAMLAYEAATR
ncbi:methylated-DNA--[protein]-cysteine S-methyltransferase [Glycocaulis sp.]|uniref:methylated-DNA--[protein]-cysteine S-methyltransferase n=1 Tax=Glycocaulis sp. TaxID=1969725 RepID=UPI003F6F2B37